MVRVCAKAITIVNNCVVIIFLNSVFLTMVDDIHVIVRIYEKKSSSFNSTTYESMY